MACDIPKTRALVSFNRTLPLCHTLKGGEYKYTSFTHVLREEYATRGFRGTFRGLTPTLCGQFCFAGLNFGLLSFFMPLVPEKTDGSGLGEPAAVMMASCWASRFSQLFAYPFDTCRRVMQANPACGSMRAEMGMLWKEGKAGLFRGIVPSLYKIAPSVTV